MKGPFQDLFDFSRKEQLGLMILVTVILCCLIIVNFHSYIFPEPTIDASLKEKTLLAAINSLQERESSNFKFTHSTAEPVDLPEPFQFDPNELDVAGYVGLGFSDKQAQSIKNYFDKGGRVYKVEDFKRIYVVNDFMFERLKGFILIDKVERHPTRAKTSPSKMDKEIPSNATPLAGQFVETPLRIGLNQSDSDQLISLKGIGPVYAKRILSYRDLLGGYSSIDQLKEVYGLKDKPEIIESLRSQLSIDPIHIRRIDINSAEWKDLVQHPYIDSKVANSIINIRENHGPYQSVEELSRSHLIDEELLQKISPYLMVIE
jgi:DNA uptake protein ComE-like DNA-binding protein